MVARISHNHGMVMYQVCNPDGVLVLKVDVSVSGDQRPISHVLSSFALFYVVFSYASTTISIKPMMHHNILHIYNV